MRGQANLPALAIALLVVTTVAGLSLTVADGAFTSAERDATARTTAETVADRLVAADSPVSDRSNVLNGSRLDGEQIDSMVPPDADVEVTVDGEVVYSRGNPTDGRTVRRLVLVADRQRVTISPSLDFGSVTLPRRSPRVTLGIVAGANVRTVRANDRVVLHDPAGIEGKHDVALSRYETTTLQFEGDVDDGDVTVTYYPRQRTKALLEVTVDA
ncbi:MAG: hypothetical protein ACI8UR_000438 [Natronomonas sp.]|jgi:hypothetical protein|uniref:DUF7263 family protein n=1 Tax=Natronomonas sp. TaxID=2184060 RepID=UPI003988D882